MTKQIPCSNKTHKKIKKLAADRGQTMKKFMDAKFAIIVLLVIGFSSVYATEVTVDVPFDFWNTDFCTFIGFPLENGTTLYEYECVWTGWVHQISPEWQIILPEDVIELPLPLAPEAFVVIPPTDRPEIEEPKDQMDLDFEEFFEEPEPLTFEQKQIVAALEKLDECRTGLGAWAAFQEQAAIEHYVNASRYSFGTGETGSEQHQILRILKAIEECRIMDKGARAGTVSIAHLHAYMADQLGLDYLGREQTQFGETDFSDQMVHTDPLTDEDFEDEIEAAETYLDNAPFQNPYKELTGVNRGGFTEGKKCDTKGQPAEIGKLAEEVCPLDRYNQFIIDNPPKTYEDALQALCEHYLDDYAHKYGTDDFPAWLNHCDIPVEVEEQ